MNKQSNIYTVIYIIVLVVVVGSALAMTALSLKEKQQANEDNDRRKQILASVNITPDPTQISADFEKYITSQLVVNANGDSIGDNAFDVSVQKQLKNELSKRQLPLFICTLDGSKKYIIPLYGAGLWGPIWGYIALDSDGSTVYGAYFDHQGETPGLGAEITTEKFRGQFAGKELFKGDEFFPVTVVKQGQKPQDNSDYVYGISGGTITSKGVAAMLDECLKPYQAYLNKLSSNGR
ncbi:MAG: NADH:ubiquinone reductase (Na(+)-transporting) subunit C [Muribaculaceae bacterium]|nr:NADH:ubiquinone reductase (Na(+)-transporting) subunit C [Muribaculaceae bacterium]